MVNGHVREMSAIIRECQSSGGIDVFSLLLKTSIATRQA